ncbi:hypothetical protein Hanom_Chr07g00602831 [Helianthus anomalus]
MCIISIYNRTHFSLYGCQPPSATAFHHSQHHYHTTPLHSDHTSTTTLECT